MTWNFPSYLHISVLKEINLCVKFVEFFDVLGYRLNDRHSIAIMSRLALGPTWPLIWRVPGALSLGLEQLGINVTTCFHLVLRLRMCGAVPPLPHFFMVWCLIMHWSSQYQGFFTWGKSGQGVKLTAHLHLVPEYVELYLHCHNIS
jgi:hypothetical protein